MSNEEEKKPTLKKSEQEPIEGVDWEDPIPEPYDDESPEEDDTNLTDEQKKKRNLEALSEYVHKMTYMPELSARKKPVLKKSKKLEDPYVKAKKERNEKKKSKGGGKKEGGDENEGEGENEDGDKKGGSAPAEVKNFDEWIARHKGKRKGKKEVENKDKEDKGTGKDKKQKPPKKWNVCNKEDGKAGDKPFNYGKHYDKLKASLPYRLTELGPEKRFLIDNYNTFKDTLQPTLRAKRLERKVAAFGAMTTEQLERVIRQEKASNKKKDDLAKQKQEVFYNMLSKLENQCREQYLNVLLKKFSSFVSKLATSMRIPPDLVEPYARMQRGLFCNILMAIGVQPKSEAAMYYNTKDAAQYEICHKLAHALLSLIIKALDSAATMTPQEKEPSDTEFEMDNYIRDRLMCAAEKKINTLRITKTRKERSPLEKIMQKCECQVNMNMEDL